MESLKDSTARRVRGCQGGCLFVTKDQYIERVDGHICHPQCHCILEELVWKPGWAWASWAGLVREGEESGLWLASWPPVVFSLMWKRFWLILAWLSHESNSCLIFGVSVCQCLFVFLLFSSWLLLYVDNGRWDFRLSKIEFTKKGGGVTFSVPITWLILKILYPSCIPGRWWVVGSQGGKRKRKEKKRCFLFECMKLRSS